MSYERDEEGFTIRARCDRCGQALDLHKGVDFTGWASWMFGSRNAHPSGSGQLCPTCSDSFRSWFGREINTFDPVADPLDVA